MSILGGGKREFTNIFENSPLFFHRQGGNFTYLHRERRKKSNKCNKFSLFNKNPPCFSNPRKDTEVDTVMPMVVLFSKHRDIKVIK
jgi:hypothetical protein